MSRDSGDVEKSFNLYIQDPFLFGVFARLGLFILGEIGGPGRSDGEEFFRLSSDGFTLKKALTKRFPTNAWT